MSVVHARLESVVPASHASEQAVHTATMTCVRVDT
jgi:hypothetical protein